MLRSRMKAAEQFTDWVTHDVLPSIRKYGSYKIKKESEKKLAAIMQKMNFLEKENKKINEENKKVHHHNNKLKNDLKKEKYPSGGLVYAIDHSTKDEEAYRLGMTHNMKTRKKYMTRILCINIR